MMERFASESDFQECSRIHRRYGTTYYFASRHLPAQVRKHVDATYGFVRVPDEWVDNPGDLTQAEVSQLLKGYRQELLAAHYGARPNHPVLRAFVDTIRDTGLPLDEAIIFLDAMEQDLTITEYPDYPSLRKYMRGSASAVGIMMLYVLGAAPNEETREPAMALGEAMQLTNFLRDIGEDLGRGRVYMPADELAQFGLSRAELEQGEVTPEFRAFMKMQIDRARLLYLEADKGIPALPNQVRFGVALARELYAKILDKIEAADYDVFQQRAKTTPQEKMISVWRLWSKMA